MPYNQQFLDEPYSSQTDLLQTDSQPEAVILDFSDFIANWQAAPFYDQPDDTVTLALEDQLPAQWSTLDPQQGLDLEFDQEVSTPIINGNIDDQARQAVQDLNLDPQLLQAPDITQEQTHDLDDFGR